MTTATPLSLVVLYVSDLPSSVAFYSALGLRFVDEKHGSGPLHYSVSLPGGTVMELYPRGNREASRTRLGFTVTDLDAAVASVEAASGRGPVGPPDRRADGLVAVMLDPDGNKVELVET